jgi:hypothetical protein
VPDSTGRGAVPVSTCYPIAPLYRAPDAFDTFEGAPVAPGVLGGLLSGVYLILPFLAVH